MKVHEHPMRVEYESGGNAAFVPPSTSVAGAVKVDTYTGAVELPELREDVVFAAKEIRSLCRQEALNAPQS